MKAPSTSSPRLDAPAYKIASFEVTDLPLIAYAAERGKPMIISTGMANLEEISEAVATARANGAAGVALLHCVSAYPAPIEDANVAKVPHLSAVFDCVTGLSDHTPGSAAAVASIALGGAIVEKHFTLSRADGGPDAAFSLEPDEFKRFVTDCKDALARDRPRELRCRRQRTRQQGIPALAFCRACDRQGRNPDARQHSLDPTGRRTAAEGPAGGTRP